LGLRVWGVGPRIPLVGKRDVAHVAMEAVAEAPQAPDEALADEFNLRAAG